MIAGNKISIAQLEKFKRDTEKDIELSGNKLTQ